MLLMIVQKGLSNGIIYSQIIEKAIAISKFKKVIIAIHSSQFDQFTNNNSIIFFKYNEYSEIKILLKNNIQVYFRDIISYLSLYKYTFNNNYKFNSFYSFRALLHEESFYNHKSINKKILIYLLEFFVFLTAKNVGCVSEEMKLVLNKRFIFKRRIIVHPCCVSNVSYKDILKFNKSNTIKFVYVGGLSKWQMFTEIINVFDKLVESINYKIELTVVTNEVNNAKETIIKESKYYKKIKCISLSQYEVGSYIKQFDYGFLLRENSIINKTASPVKFLEYISNGVIPIMSENIGDYSTLVKKKNLGIILNKNNNFDYKYLDKFLNDENIYNRLYETSKFYTWEWIFKSNHNDPLITY
jgi:glycosyltransferase involved in cell wall biosynthesis